MCFHKMSLLEPAQMNWSPAFYDSQTLGNILKDKMGYTLMIGIKQEIPEVLR